MCKTDYGGGGGGGGKNVPKIDYVICERPLTGQEFHQNRVISVQKSSHLNIENGRTIGVSWALDPAIHC